MFQNKKGSNGDSLKSDVVEEKGPGKSCSKHHKLDHLAAGIRCETIVDQKRRPQWGCVIMDIDSDFHSLRAVAFAAEEVIWLCICEIKDVTTTLCNILYEVFVNAILVACLVHLQNIIGVLVKPEILKMERYMELLLDVTLRQILIKKI